MGTFVPYCGAAPVPGSLSWNLDPILIGALLLVALAYLSLAQAEARQKAQFICGLAVFAAAIISPLCNLSVALFSARVTQHMIVALVAAPLLAGGLPSLPAGLRRRLWTSVAVFTAVFWLWHSPRAYDATLRNNEVYWSMQLSILAAAVWTWRAILSAAAFPAFAAVTAAGLQMSFLGALITLTSSALYEVHANTTWPWGLTQIDDQHLGGLLMWVPAGLFITAWSALALGLALNRMEQRAPATSP